MKEKPAAIKALAERSIVGFVATRSDGRDHVGEFTTIEWKHPAHGHHRTVFQIRGCLLIATGDTGNAIYGWSSPHNLEWFKELDVDYFAGKKMTDRPKVYNKLCPTAQWHFYCLQGAIAYLTSARTPPGEAVPQ